jgi:hypothetical protein
MSTPPRDPVTGRFLPRSAVPEADLPLDGGQVLHEVDRRVPGWKRWLRRSTRR